MQKRKGRPPKTAIVAKTPGKLTKLGRPPGEAAAMAEFKARLMTSPKSHKVIEAIFNAAVDDNHKNQAAAWKLLLDRMIPISSMEAAAAGGKSAITINISGLGITAKAATGEDFSEGEDLDGEFSEDLPAGEDLPEDEGV
jgi:hypothetical protein